MIAVALQYWLHIYSLGGSTVVLSVDPDYNVTVLAVSGRYQRNRYTVLLDNYYQMKRTRDRRRDEQSESPQRRNRTRVEYVTPNGNCIETNYISSVITTRSFVSVVELPTRIRISIDALVGNQRRDQRAGFCIFPYMISKRPIFEYFLEAFKLIRRVNRPGAMWFETLSVSPSRKSKLSLRPRGTRLAHL